jgi:hypothetical protein
LAAPVITSVGRFWSWSVKDVFLRARAAVQVSLSGEGPGVKMRCTFSDGRPGADEQLAGRCGSPSPDRGRACRRWARALRLSSCGGSGTRTPGEVLQVIAPLPSVVLLFFAVPYGHGHFWHLCPYSGIDPQTLCVRQTGRQSYRPSVVPARQGLCQRLEVRSHHAMDRA